MTQISLDKKPVPVPEPFASMLHYHQHSRPNLRTTGGSIGTPRLFPSCVPGKHIDPQALMQRLRQLGITLLGGRNTALRELVSAAPAPLIAEMLGYSYQFAHLHAELTGQPWARYVTGNH